MLQNLFAAVAPGSLWPVDVLLRVLFCDVDQASVVNEINLATSLLQSVCFPSQAVNRNTKHIFNKRTLLTIISSLIFSKRFYCSNVWPSTSKGNITKLQSIQNFACRIVCGACKYDHVTPVLKLHGGAKI